MKKRVLILLCFISIGINQTCCAQNQNKIDSLLNVLKRAKEDTGKVNTLNELGRELSSSNPDTSIILANQALSLSEKIASKKHIANSYHVIALANDIKGNYPSSLENNFKALSLREELTDKSGIAKSLGKIGTVYMEQADYPKALDYYFKALKMTEQLGDKEGITIHLGNIGSVYKKQGDYPKALDHYFKSLKMEEELGDKNGIAIDLANIGLVYYEQKDYPKALDYYFKSLKKAEQLGNKYLIATLLANIGSVYSEQGDDPKALDYYFKVLNMAEQLGDKNFISIQLGNIGIVYTKTGKFAEAEEYLKKAIAINDSIGALDNLRQFEKSLSQLYDTTGRYKLALEHYKKAMVLKDTLFNQEKNKEITRKEMNYEFAKKEEATKAEQDKKDAIAQQQIQKQKILKYSFIGGLGLVIVLLLFGYRVYKTRQVLRLQDIRNKIAADLHDDIGSTLNSISVYSEVARKDAARMDFALKMIGESSRKIIDSLSDIVWSINPENDNFDKIILRMRSLTHNLLKAKKIECTFKADESLNEIKLPMEIRRNFYLIFKEALNNLVKYSNANRASVILTLDNREVTCIIRDDGIGFDASLKYNSNGLNNMKRRANEIKAMFNIESGIGKGTSVELNMKI